MLGDLRINKSRTALVAVSIAIGVFCVGMVAGTRTIVSHYLTADYTAAHPPAATLLTDPFGDGLLRKVRALPGVSRATGRYRLSARLQAGSSAWQDLTVFAPVSFQTQTFNRLSRVSGAWPPPAGQLLLTRASLAYLDLRLGERVHVRLPNGRQRVLRVAGTVIDILQPSPFVSGMSYAYVTSRTLAWLGVPHRFNELDIGVAGNTRDRAQVQRIAARARDLVERSGRQVYSTQVPEPGNFWANDAIQTMLLLLLILGAVALVMSGFLVINTVGATMTRHVRQVGVMKAIGGTPRQIAAMYLAMVLPPSLIALVVAVPLGAFGAFELTSYATTLLDFNAAPGVPSLSVLAVEVGAGIVVPLLAALGPIVAGSAITVREAITSHGVGETTGAGLGARVERLERVPRPVLLSLSNAFRRRVRLALTLSAMALGGTVFIAVLSVRGSLLQTLDDVMAYSNYDVQIVFSRPYHLSQVEHVVRSVPGVDAAEGWESVTAQRIGPGHASSTDITLTGLPPRSSLIKPSLLRGRWLRPSDASALVVNSDLVAAEPDLKPGRALRLTVNRRTSRWTVVGIVRGVQAGPIAYVPFSSLAKATATSDLVDQVQIVGAGHDVAAEGTLALAVEKRLQRTGFSIASSRTTADQRAVIAANYDLIVVFLLAMAILLGLVGGLGLMGTLGINVLERTREIGVMRAIGASDANVIQVVMAEGVLVAAISWVFAALIALPLSPLLTQAVGQAFLKTQLDYRFSAPGALIWLVGVLAIAALAGFIPARSATRLTVRDILAYE